LLHEAIQYVVCFLTRIGQFRCVAVQLHLLNLHKKKTQSHISAVLVTQLDLFQPLC